MARILLTGGETGDLSELAATTAGVSIDGTVANASNGAYSFKSNSITVFPQLTTGLNHSHLFYKVYFRLSDLTAITGVNQVAYELAWFGSGSSNAELVVIQNSSGVFLRVFDAGEANFFDVAISVSVNTWYRVDMELIVGAGTGAANVYLDGVQKHALTGKQFGAGNVTQIGLLYQIVSGVAARDWWMDDIEIDDAALCGESYVLARQFQSGAPTYDSWTKSSGTVDSVWSDTPFSAASNASSFTVSEAQTALVSSWSSAQAGHGSGVVAAGDTINGSKLAIVGKTAATTAAGITEVGTSQSGSSTAGANITLTFSPAPQAGDTVLLIGGFGTAGANNPGPSTAGYTQQFLDTATATRRFGVWSKVMGATPDTTVVGLGSGTAGDGVAYLSVVLRQIDNSVILDVAVPAGATGSSTNPNPPASGATATANAMVISCAASAVNDTSKGTQTNYTQEASPSANATRPYSCTASRRIIAAAGTNEDPPAWSTWATGAWVAATITIRPALFAGSQFAGVFRIAGADSFNAFTLTTSDAYYETIGGTGTLTDFNASEWGVVHGVNSLLQTVEDAWAFVSYTPGVAPSGIQNKLYQLSQAAKRAAYW